MPTAGELPSEDHAAGAASPSEDHAAGATSPSEDHAAGATSPSEDHAAGATSPSEDHAAGAASPSEDHAAGAASPSEDHAAGATSPSEDHAAGAASPSEDHAAGAASPSEDHAAGATSPSEDHAAGATSPSEVHAAGATSPSEDHAAGATSPSEDHAAGATSPSEDHAAGATSPSEDHAAGATSPSEDHAAGATSPSEDHAAGATSPSEDHAAGAASPSEDHAAGATSPSEDHAAGATSPSEDHAAGVTSPSEDHAAGATSVAQRSDSEAGKSADSDGGRRPLRTYRRRWYVLLLYSALNCVQCAVWNTFGPITATAQAAFPGWDNTTISLLSNLSCAAFLAFVAPYCWLLSRFGLRPAVLVMAFCVALGTALRSSSSDETAFTATAYTCAVLNGIAGIMCMAAPAYLSSVWFPPEQRVTATSLPAVCRQLGGALSFVVGPRLVRLPGGADPQTDPDAARYNVMLLMDVETGVAAVLFLAVLIYFPSRPPLPPSLSASRPPPAGSFWRGLKQAARAPDLPWLVLAYVVPGGVQAAYFAVLDISVAPLGVTEEQAGWLGFWASLGSCVSALMVARLTDLFQGHVKLTLLALLLAGTACYAWLLALVTGWLPFSLPSLYGAVLLALTMTYATAPLLYEYTAELTYPVSADVVGAVMSVTVTIVNGLSLLLFLIKPLSEDTRWLNYALVVALPLSMVMLLKTREVYRRTEADRGLAGGDGTTEAAPGSGEPKDENGVRQRPWIELHGFDNEAILIFELS